MVKVRKAQVAALRQHALHRQFGVVDLRQPRQHLLHITAFELPDQDEDQPQRGVVLAEQLDRRSVP